jgi:hypothetical protein
MAELRRRGGLVTILVAADGRMWRPRDVSRNAATGQLRATAKSFPAPFRLFVAEDGERRLYAMQPGDVRDLVPDALQRQLEAAVVVQGGRDG